MTLGYDLSPYGADGQFGRKTEAAVKAFQRDHGLKQDGIAGRMTWEALLQAADGKTERLFTVTVPHLTEAQAEVLLQSYAGAARAEEG